MRLLRTGMAFTAVVVASACATAGQTWVIHAYASEQENRELAPVHAIAYDSVAFQKKLEEILAVNPQNRPGRLMLAELLLSQGRIKQAKEAVKVLLQVKPAYPTMDFQLQLGKATNDKALQASAYAALTTDKDTDYWAGPKAEFEGDLIAAEKAYKNVVTASRGPSSFYPQYRFVEFLIRQGRYTEAIDAIEPLLAKAQSISSGWVSRVYLDRALAYWASAEMGKATEDAILAAELSLAPGHGSKHVLAEKVLAAYVLTRQQRTGSNERARVDKLFAQALKRASPGNPYSLDAVLFAIPSEKDRAQVIVRLGEVLKEAPGLDWALWGSLYMGFIAPDEAKELMSKLPKGSIQSRIWTRTGPGPRN